MQRLILYFAALIVSLLSGCSGGKETAGDKVSTLTQTGGSTSYSLGADENRIDNISFTSSEAWRSYVSYSGSPGWLSVEPYAGQEAGTYTLSVTVARNNSADSRTATLIIKCGNASDLLFTINQDGAEPEMPEEPDDPSKTTVVTSLKLGTGMANPLLDFQFCADPTAIEYDGRLYVYGTNDHQQYEEAQSNTYERIKSLVIMSTDDMVNWTYHGLIPVGEIAPWIIASWAPSVISVPQSDGGTLFSLYFSNSGWGTGVLQSKSPLGPWTSPLNTSLIDGNNKTVKGSGAIFDPGAVVDDNGDAWVAFGSGQGWIAKLNPDLTSIEGNPVKLPSFYHFEANELNFINGTYVYTYNNDWSDHSPWTWGGTKPTMCSMNYFTSKTPLVTDSWTYGANYFKNPGENNMGYTNNHTHLHKYKGKWYLFYQTNLMQSCLGSDGGFRSIYVNEIEVDEQNMVIHECIPTKKGISAIKKLDPYAKQSAATSAATLGIIFKATDKPGHMTAARGTPCITANKPKIGIIEVRDVSFTSGGQTLSCRLKGIGRIAFRLDKQDASDFASFSGTGDDWTDQEVSCTLEGGTHTLYIVISGNIELDTWQFIS